MKLPISRLAATPCRASEPVWHASGVSTNAPASTYVLVSSVITTFCTFGWVVIFLPAWTWYLIPAACAVPAIVILVQRWIRRQRIKRELQETLAQLG